MRNFVRLNFVPFTLSLLVFMVTIPFIESVTHMYSDERDGMSITLYCKDLSKLTGRYEMNFYEGKQ